MNSRVLTTIALCSATLTLITTAAPAAAAVKANANQPKVSRTDAVIEKAKAFADIDLSQATPIDTANNIKGISVIGSPKVETDTNLNDGKVTTFDGKSAYKLPISNDQYKQVETGIALEAFFKYSGDNTKGEHDILSSKDNLGFSLGINENDQLTYYSSDQKSAKTISADLKKDRWVHVVGVTDVAHNQTSLYVNGKLRGTAYNNGGFKAADQLKSFMLGADSVDANGNLKAAMKGKIKAARIYTQSLTGDQVKQLSDTARKSVHDEAPIKQAFDTQLFGATDVVAGHNYNLNVHTRQLKAGDVDKVEYDVTFDPAKFEYAGADQLLGGDKATAVTATNDHTLHITSTADFSTREMREYSQNRLARVRLKAKQTSHDDKTTVTLKNASVSLAGKKQDKSDMTFGSNQTIAIHAKDKRDFNGDGLIGVGDVALAPEDQKVAVAKDAEIQPYKHVIVLTTDGGGNPWNPKGMYYALNEQSLPLWTDNPAVMEKRKNPYAMDLFNNKFAMSTTAKSVQPTVSAQNYTSMIHSVTWGDMDLNYQDTNTTAGEQYFADFGKTKETEKYPSVFKVLQRAQPKRNLAAFSEWAPFLNGIMEPDAAMEKEQPAAFKSFDDVADYIGSDKFNDTSFIHMQSDQMDIRAHGHGWYNDDYWEHYARYDQMFKTVMDKLEKTGHIHDTLIIANADHGGSMRAHGQKAYTHDPSNYNIFIGLGGETVDAGRRLHGGSNTDIGALVLNALKVKQPTSMTGKVFDPSAFLDQTELVKKHRQVEAVNLERTANKFTLKFKPENNRQIRTIDTRIDLAGQSVDKVEVPTGARVLRQDVKDGILKLTLSFKQQPGNTMATVSMKGNPTRSAGKVAIKEAMLGTDKGQEVLSDLANKDVTSIANPGSGSHVVVPSTSGNTTKPKKPVKPSQNKGETKPTVTKKPSKHKKNALKGKIVYAKKKIGFYKKTKFTKKNRYKFFTAKSENKWAQFKIVKKKGNRYQVKDINKGSKTYGKLGYITTSSKFVTPAEYAKKAVKVKVINPRGLSAYKTKSLKGKATHYKKNAVLKIKKIVKVNGKYHFQLKNGKYITADKHLIHAYFNK
ncbi:LamG-like jellyroll fold domain-containing protein [Lactiplantibacillus daowaiensis]|uniref:LamG-like jellyroll fold domain-containing protein n=1 Tax=Lactiplantibacillus daowaiensis TaxID=2559918 RepID=A0ABW1S2B3_9LACO|nr:LamG-like jellyroll fold domain-containing protein [Lactiplantibacillus daowaiensis]